MQLGNDRPEPEPEPVKTWPWWQHLEQKVTQTLDISSCLITLFSRSGVDNPGDHVVQPGGGDQDGGGVPVPRLQEPARHHERRQGGGPGLDALLGGARRLLDGGDYRRPAPGLLPRLPPRQVRLPGLVHGAHGQERLQPCLHSGERKYLAI